MAATTPTADELDGSEPPEVALPLLVDAYGGRLYALGLRFCGNAEEAQDMVQETFLQAWRKWEQFEGRARASTWLYRIASRVCQRFHRKRAGEPDRLESLDALPFAGADLAVVPDGPLTRVLREDARSEVEQAIADLPLAFRMPLVLKEIAGFSVAEVADVLGLKAATVKTRLHRARLRVRQALEGRCRAARCRRRCSPSRSAWTSCVRSRTASTAAWPSSSPIRWSASAARSSSRPWT